MRNAGPSATGDQSTSGRIGLTNVITDLEPVPAPERLPSRSGSLPTGQSDGTPDQVVAHNHERGIGEKDCYIAPAPRNSNEIG